MLVKTIIDQAQERLHDNGSIWPRTELLDWLNDGYRQLLAQSHACVRPFQLDVPGRVAYSGTQDWEDRHGRGTFLKLTKTVASGQFQATYRWEAEFLDGLAPTASNDFVTQPWERAFSGATDHHFTFVLSKAHDRPLKVYWDDKQLVGASTRELDLRQTEWWNEGGEPVFWFPATGGRAQSYELYEIITAYNQAYALQEMEAGIPRAYSGDRTYSVSSSVDRWDFAYSGSADVGFFTDLGYRFTLQVSDADRTTVTFLWEKQVLDGATAFTDAKTIYTHWWEAEFVATADLATVYPGVGLPRYHSSPDRQYLPAPYDTGELQLLGAIRDFKSSKSSLTVWEIIIPTRALTETDVPALVPAQFGKYLKFYILSRAFSRKGEGFRPDFTQHYAALFQVGVALLSKLASPTFLDRVYGREEFAPAGPSRPPRVRFPATFENPWT